MKTDLLEEILLELCELKTQLQKSKLTDYEKSVESILTNITRYLNSKFSKSNSFESVENVNDKVTALKKNILGLVLLKISFERLTRDQIKCKIEQLLEETEPVKQKNYKAKKCNSKLTG